MDSNGVIARGYNKCFEQPQEIYLDLAPEIMDKEEPEEFFIEQPIRYACACMDIEDPCTAMLSRPVLVRATIQNVTAVVDEGSPLNANGNPYFEDAIMNHYSVKIEKVYENNAGAPNVVEGQTIEVRARATSNRCGIKFQTESEMFLDLDPKSNGEYFVTSSCSMNSRMDSSGSIMRSGYNECFELEQPKEIHEMDKDLFCPSCGELKDPCTAMLFRPVLVRATIHNETKVGYNYYYDAIIQTVFANAQIHVEEGQTIRFRVGAFRSRFGCGVDRYKTESDMILDLAPPSALDGDYFSTDSCRMNSIIDSNGVFERSDYNECFDQTLRLKGQSDVSPAVVPKSVLQISPKLTKEERKAAKKSAKEAKEAANQAERKKTQAKNKALKKTQKKDVATIWEACP
eukprot:scaffold335968_cov35-Attheya_sp.AAC.1